MRLIGKKMMITPWGIFAAPKAIVRENDYIHESIHIAQAKELLWIGFVLLYVLEWIIRQLWYSIFWLYRFSRGNFRKLEYKKDYAYRLITFEREAYRNDKNAEYLLNRPRFNFINYI